MRRKISFGSYSASVIEDVLFYIANRARNDRPIVVRLEASRAPARQRNTRTVSVCSVRRNNCRCHRDGREGKASWSRKLLGIGLESVLHFLAEIACWSSPTVERVNHVLPVASGDRFAVKQP